MTKHLLIPIPLAIWLAGCGEAPREKSSVSSAPPVAVSTVTATTETWPSIYEATGTVRARTSAVIAAKMMGYVREVKVQAGDRVHAGQTLVTLDTRDLDIGSRRAEAAREEVRTAVPEADGAVAAASANLDLAQATFGRMRDLFQKKSISNQLTSSSWPWSAASTTWGSKGSAPRKGTLAAWAVCCAAAAS